jgi:hypothetical protein
MRIAVGVVYEIQRAHDECKTRDHIDNDIREKSSKILSVEDTEVQYKILTTIHCCLAVNKCKISCQNSNFFSSNLAGR